MERLGTRPDGPGRQHLLDMLVHLGVGLAGGATYGALMLRRSQPGLAGGALFGLGLWAAAFGLIMPALGITRAPTRGTRRETAVNSAAHVLYGTVTALVAQELRAQAHGLDAAARALRARVG
jgi:uncharacterized membrane protein YagU involved in acid resistance